MNTPMHFSIDDKTIYQMGLNHGASTHSTTNYVPENNTTAVLTNQILEILNPTTSTDDNTRLLFTELMAPHYQKQEEISEKLDKLSATITNFIEMQQSINEFIIDKLLKTVRNSTPTIDQGFNSANLENKQNSCDHILLNETNIQAPSTSDQPNSEQNEPNTKMSVREFLKNTITVSKLEENEEENEDDDAEDWDTMRKYNKFRVRNPPKKYKRSLPFVPPVTQEISSNEKPDNVLQPNFVHPIAVSSAQNLNDTSNSTDLNLLNHHMDPSTSFVLNQVSNIEHLHNLPAGPSTSQELKFPSQIKNGNNTLKPIHDFSQLAVDAQPALQKYPFSDNNPGNTSSFLHFNDPHSRSAFVPAMAHHQKERR